jgi:transketolase
VPDSEDVEALTAAVEAGRAETERPSFIAVRSHIAYPAPHAVDTAKSHGAPLGEEEVAATKRVMGMDPDRSFVVEPRVYEHMSLRARGEQVQAQWSERLAAWREQHPDMAADWDLAWAGGLREGWREALPTFAAGEKIATRAAGQKTMAAFAQFAPTMVGGAADLVESTKTLFEGAGEFSRVHSGRNVPFGIREHAMGAIVNGAAAHGGLVKPYGSTFLIFSDYMRGAVRLSALMGLPVLWVWTHDSIGLGEDGPTHQPVEHFSALRAIPRLWVIRPADANETAYAWRVALEREDGPVALLLSRQNLEVLDRTEVAGADGLERGGYVLWDSAPEPQLVLISTGSEVGLTLAAARTLADEGVAVRVVSMPCMELFEAQSADYREQVLPAAVRARLAIEPGVSMSWWRWVGSDGDVLSLERFGASAPGPIVLEKLGYSIENVIARARAVLKP